MTNFKKILLIDVGGTNIDLYEYHPHRKLSKLIKQVNTVNIDIHQWIHTFGSKLYKNYQKIILGLPGEINEKDEEVFCPPLGKTIEIKSIKDKGIAIVNDMFIQAFLIDFDKSIKNSDKVILNSGTSVGLCIINSKFFENYKLSHIKSFEFAHESLVETGKSKSLYNLISQNTGFQCKKFCSIYSVGGFAAAQGLKVDITKEEMFRINKNEFKESIKNNKIDASISSMWISSLERDLKYFLSKKYTFNSKPAVILRGGLISAFSSCPDQKFLNSFKVNF